MSLSPENQALVERFYREGSPEALDLGATPFHRLNACLNAARAEGPAQPPQPDAGEWVRVLGRIKWLASDWESPVMKAWDAARAWLKINGDDGGSMPRDIIEAGFSNIYEEADTALRAMIAAAPQQLSADIGQLEASSLDALKTAEAWLSRWAAHAGNCLGCERCTCGLTAVQFELARAIGDAEPLPHPPSGEGR